jgi:hypothetical protein
VRGGASYTSQKDLRMHFGLAANGKMQELRFAGRTAKLKLCAMSRRISFTRWSRAQASAKKWLCLLCHDEPGFSEPDFLNLLFSQYCGEL